MTLKLKSTIRPRARAIAWLFMLLYFSSYVMRINFAVMMVKICSDMNLEKTALAVVITGLTVAYACGQLISGYIGDKIKPQIIIAAGLLFAVLSNVAISFFHSVVAMTIVWVVNGLAHAMLWPPMVRMLATYLTDEEYGYGMVRTVCGSQGATVLLYLVCPLLLRVMSWRAVMLICAAVGALVLLLWVSLSRRLFTDPVGLKEVQEQDTEVQKKPVASKIPSYVIFPLVMIMAALVLQGMLRDGVTNWMPFYMKETFHFPEEDAIISTAILGVFNILSFSFFNWIHKKFFRNEVFCAAVIFIFSTVCALVLWIADSLAANAVVSMLFMACIVGAMHGVNLMLISVVPKRFLKLGKVSTYSGLLNAFTYVGAALASYGFAALAELFNWNVVIMTWIFIAGLGFATCLLSTPIWKRFCKEYAE